MSRITPLFDDLRRAGRAALMPYLTIGYPERESADDLVPAVIEAGADLLELGVPFSDPLADGATVQHSTQQALANGITLADCLATVGRLRERGVTAPLTLMGYYNPIYQMGLARFAAGAAAVGVDGVIVPDLPPEEAADLDAALAAEGLDYIYFLAPTSDAARIRLVAERARGFIYLVSLTGVTGARDRLPAELPAFIARVREATGGRTPLAVGFGIGSPESARAVAAHADGVIVGSALVRLLADPTTAEHEARTFVAALRAAL